MLRNIMLAVIFVLSVQSGLYALTAKEIIEKSEKTIQGDTQTAKIDITIKTRRWTRTMTMNSWSQRKTKKSFSEIVSPAKDAGTRFMLMDKNMWQYVPKLQQTIKISPSMMMQSWMGSDLTNDDIVKESSTVNDYTHELLGVENTDSVRCYKIQLTPKPDAAVVWGKIIYYARESDCLPVRQEFYNERSQLKKIMTCSGFRKMHDRVIPTVFRIESAGKEDQYTLMEIKDTQFDTPIPARIFTMQNLQRR